jgi:hypothetical protein
MINQDMQLDSKVFKTKEEARSWASDLKEENQAMGKVRFTIKEVLNDPNIKWEATVYIRKTKK